ncbi:hypothetical protein ABPG75_004874 [Micractinium tetrahymenae]
MPGADVFVFVRKTDGTSLSFSAGAVYTPQSVHDELVTSALDIYNENYARLARGELTLHTSAARAPRAGRVAVTPYNVFYTERLERWKQVSGSTNAKDWSRPCSAAWKELSKEEKDRYADMAREKARQVQNASTAETASGAEHRGPTSFAAWSTACIPLGGHRSDPYGCVFGFL